jgi:putative flippase GtrA
MATPRFFGMMAVVGAGFIARYLSLGVGNALIGLAVVWLAIEVIREYRRGS